MLRVITGSFHPDLERALVEKVRTCKAADPLAALTIVVPSDTLRRRVKWLLCVEQQCALFDVHFLTFHQFAVRLLQDAGVLDLSSIRTDFFFQELVHQLLIARTRREGKEAQWSDLSEMPGAWGALLATLRDVTDARIDPERVLEALSQCETGPPADLQPLMELYRAFLDEKTRMNVVDVDDLASLAEPYVAHSPFLQRQQEILYYGFYDVTQVQLDLFRMVASTYSTTLLFPLVKGDPAYGFAERFFERHILGLVRHEAGRETNICSAVHGEQCTLWPGHTCRIFSVSGPVDELTVVAKDILGLVEERGYSFQDIGVVSRTLSGYETLLPHIFDQHAIPFSSTIARPLSEFPYVKACMHLFDLRVSGFRRERLIELLSSPFLHRSSLAPSGTVPRPDLWDVATRRLGITKGMDEWARLTKYLKKDLPLRDDGGDEQDLVGPCIPSVDIQNLWTIVSALADSLQSVPEMGTWETYSDHVHRLRIHWLDATGGHPEGFSGADEVMASTDQALSELRRLNALGPEVPLSEFTAAFHRLMEHTLLPIGVERHGGVQVLDAMAARGVAFRALYVLGLNEKVFPRHIREDAFLRDQTRRLLEVDLGFKIQEKLTGYDEEFLLFTLLCRSAREQLTLLYQRTDEAGRSLLPSGYLAEVERITGGEQVVPRRLTVKFQAVPQYHQDRLTPAEIATKSLLGRQVPRRLLEEGYPAGRSVARGLRALVALDATEDRLGAYDGITGPLEAAWQSMRSSGVSPTGLQEYATCPFRYFAKQVLRLRPFTMPESIDQVGPAELGTLAHNILRRGMEALSAKGYFSNPSIEVDPFLVLNEAACVEFDRFADSHPVGYPLVWRVHQERLLKCLRDVLREDLDEMAREDWRPLLFEEEAVGKLVVGFQSLPAQSEELSIVGRLDRVDWSPSRQAYRIIDYKFKTGRKPGTLDTNLLLGAARAARLQPPLYLTMSTALAARMPAGSVEPTCAGVWFYYLAPAWETPFLRVPFPANAWTSSCTPIMNAMTHVLSGIRSGRFFIYASGSCDRCDYRLLCRRSHQPTVWRARLDHAVVGPYRLLRSASFSIASDRET